MYATSAPEPRGRSSTAYYPAMQAGIELILDQKVALREQADKIAAAKKQIATLQNKMKKD